MAGVDLSPLFFTLICRCMDALSDLVAPIDSRPVSASAGKHQLREGTRSDLASLGSHLAPESPNIHKTSISLFS